MNLLFIVPSLANKGPVRVIQQLSLALTASGHRCTVWYLDDLAGLDFGCETRRVSFWDKLDFTGFDVIHSNGIRPDALVAKARLQGLKTPSISTIHNYVGIDLAYQYNRLVSLVFSSLWIMLWGYQQRLVVLSDDARQYYRRYFPGDKLCVIPNGLAWADSASPQPDAVLQSVAARKQNAFVIGACAQVTARKGLEQMIDLLVFEQDCVFVLVGDGKTLAALQQRAGELGVADRCVFTGFREDARAFLPLFDCVALPSRSEGFPLSFIEAAACGRPILVSNIAVFKDAVPADAAAFFELDDMDSLRAAVAQVRTRGATLGRRARVLYEREFTVEIMARRYLALYRALRLPASGAMDTNGHVEGKST